MGAGGGLGNQDPGVGDSDGEEEGVGHLFQVPPAPVLLVNHAPSPLLLPLLTWPPREWPA